MLKPVPHFDVSSVPFSLRMVTVFKYEHDSNNPSEELLTEEGIVIDLSFKQEANALLPKVSIPSLSFIDERLIQLESAPSSNVLTVEGKFMLLSLMH